MMFFFRLPFLLLELLMRRSAGALRLLVRVVGGDRYERVWPEPEMADRFAAWPGPVVEREPEPDGGRPAGPPPPTADEAIARRKAREAAAPPPPPEPPLHAVGGEDHVDREATIVESFGPADDVAGTITVDEPWDGYDGMAASVIVDRLRGSDGATKGVVRLYEQQHKKRATVLRAAS
jgi:hypothetical protein